jgi:hypothetical protein
MDFRNQKVARIAFASIAATAWMLVILTRFTTGLENVF